MKYLPQAPPFEMIDLLTAANDHESHSQFLIRKDNIFVINGIFTEPGIIENMAQTAAAGIGYQAMTKQQATPPIGFIGQIKNLNIYHLPAVGSQISTAIIIENSILNVRVLRGKVLMAQQLIAEGSFKVFINTGS
ncbi:MAG TPA: hypothetical protein VFL76_09395 [Edaphocola sp.]|nr:hypothetical protein [Edaphocola sp.]